MIVILLVALGALGLGLVGNHFFRQRSRARPPSKSKTW
jgi:hypothetical protein